ncbi:protein timeless homolog [Anopheles bellator]|uniref:protein timeless homolog n=1 Tax=Anopheles bellator TaxID=139047 RepID=UPI00264777A7|nr:protein timeless homolog [Anopheles bellator]
MADYLTTIDAMSATLGYGDINEYHADPEAIQGLKLLVWILKNDKADHEYRRYIGEKQLVQTDLIPSLVHGFHKPEIADVLLRLLVNLTFPTELLYKGTYPKDAAEQKKVLQLMEIAEQYKEAFAVKAVWSVLGEKMQQILRIDFSERSEAQSVTVERILILTRNVLQVPTNVEREQQLDDDASLHDRLLWSLHQTCTIDTVLYVLGSPLEQQYFMHSLEIMSLVYREQQPAALADATLQRRTAEKKEDEMKLIQALHPATERTKQLPTARHSRFRGTYTFGNLKSVSDNDYISHQSLNKIMNADLGIDKQRIKKSFRKMKQPDELERKSILSVRMCLREYCVEVLCLFNNIVKQARRYLSQFENTASEFHDDTYLLWAVRFFMEFNRYNGLNIELVSEALSMTTFHWIITRIEGYNDLIVCDKTRKRVWSKRLHNAIQTYDEMISNLRALSVRTDPDAKELLAVLQHNIFYAVEYRETVIQLLCNFNETYQTRSFLRVVVEVANRFFSLLEKFCNGTIRVQERAKAKRQKNRRTTATASDAPHKTKEDLEDEWLTMAPKVAAILPHIQDSPESLPTPFDAASPVPIDEQRGSCMIRIHGLLRDEKYEDAVKLMYAARSIWTTDDNCFGSSQSTPDETLMLLKEIFMANISDGSEQQNNPLSEKEDTSENEEDEEEFEATSRYVEKDFKFDDFSRRLVNPKIVRSCVIVLSDWETIKTTTLKAAVHILHRIAVEHKNPSMLFQASLFRIFQRVMCTTTTSHSIHLKQLGEYIIRQLQKVASNGNEIVFAEILFYKSVKICTAIEMGYDEVFNQHPGATGNGEMNWTEEQEDELRRLFMENQENPQTDQDVIDWLLDNIINKSRTRRGVIKKLKELGLIFKAPTKRSNINQQKQAKLWSVEQIEKLKQLYEEHRLEKNVLRRIADAFEKTFTRQAIVKQMIGLGLIADETEVRPAKTVSSHNLNQRHRGHDSSDGGTSEECDYEFPVSTQLNVPLLEKKMKTMGSSMKQSIEWVVECLQDAVKDYQQPDDDEINDGVPMIPIESYQSNALQDGNFKHFLRTLGLLNVSKEHTFWRIPFRMKPSDLEMRIDILRKYNTRGSSPEACESPDISVADADAAAVQDCVTELRVSSESDEDLETMRANPTLHAKRDRSDSSDSLQSPSQNTKKHRKRLVISDEED